MKIISHSVGWAITSDFSRSYGLARRTVCKKGVFLANLEAVAATLALILPKGRRLSEPQALARGCLPAGVYPPFVWRVWRAGCYCEACFVGRGNLYAIIWSISNTVNFPSPSISPALALRSFSEAGSNVPARPLVAQRRPRRSSSTKPGRDYLGILIVNQIPYRFNVSIGHLCLITLYFF
jgi:hypothetical protein